MIRIIMVETAMIGTNLPYCEQLKCHISPKTAVPAMIPTSAPSDFARYIAVTDSTIVKAKNQLFKTLFRYSTFDIRKFPMSHPAITKTSGPK